MNAFGARVQQLCGSGCGTQQRPAHMRQHTQECVGWHAQTAHNSGPMGQSYAYLRHSQAQSQLVIDAHGNERPTQKGGGNCCGTQLASQRVWGAMLSQTHTPWTGMTRAWDHRAATCAEQQHYHTHERQGTTGPHITCSSTTVVDTRHLLCCLVARLGQEGQSSQGLPCFPQPQSQQIQRGRP